MTLGDRVAIVLPNDPSFFVATFALWKLGATPAPISPKTPPREVAGILKLIDPPVVIAGADQQVEPFSKVLPPEQDSGPGDPLGMAQWPISPSWKAIASGGSTGQPKIILSLQNGAIDPAGGYAMQRPGDVALNPGPLYHNAAFSSAHHCLFSGGHLVNMARFDAEECLRLIGSFGVTYVMMVPTMMNRILRLPEAVRARYDISSLRVLVHLGGPCADWLKQGWIDWIGAEKVVEIYAGTEGIGATAIRGDEWLNHRGSVGLPVTGTELRVIDDEGRACASGEVGRIQMRRADGRAADFRYLGQETATGQGWCTLGDLGHVDDGGYLYISDRRTDLIVSGGVNIYPAEIEAAIEQHPAVLACIAIGLPDDDLGSRVHAIVQTGADHPAPGEEELVAYLRERLARNKIPRSFEFVTQALRDEVGKARRSQFREERLGDEKTQDK